MKIKKSFKLIFLRAFFIIISRRDQKYYPFPTYTFINLINLIIYHKTLFESSFSL